MRQNLIPLLVLIVSALISFANAAPTSQEFIFTSAPFPSAHAFTIVELPDDHLPAGLLGPIKDKPLVLHDGTIVSGTSVESYSSWAAWIDRSTDNGKTWTKIGPITVPSQPQPSQPNQAEHVSGIIQPTIVPLGNK